MGFSHAQATAYAASGGAPSSVFATLTNPPALGDLVCVCVFWFFTGTLNTVVDDNGNSYQITSLSPESANAGSAGQVALAYLLSAPSNATAKVTANFSAAPSGQASIFVDDFTVSGGTAGFQTDAKAAPTGQSSPLITPSITPSGTGQLFYSGAGVGSSITGVGGSWVENSHGPGSFGEDAAYQLNVGSATAVNFTLSGSSDCASMEMAFTFTASGGGHSASAANFNSVLVLN